MLRLCHQPGIAGLACLIKPEFQRKGYATGAGWTFIHGLAPTLKEKGFLVPLYDKAGHCIEKSPLKKIIATAWKTNEASITTLRKIGMHEEEMRISIDSPIKEMVIPFSIDLEELVKKATTNFSTHAKHPKSLMASEEVAILTIERGSVKPKDHPLR